MGSDSKGLLEIEPLELRFPFETNKQISCSMQLTNRTDDYIGFKVKTTNPRKYCVRPNNGIVPPRSTSDVIVTMQEQKVAPPDMECKDKFLVQSVIVAEGTLVKDITGDMFTKASGNVVDEVKLKVVYVPPPKPPSPVREGSEEGSSPRASLSDGSNLNYQEIKEQSSSLYSQTDLNLLIVGDKLLKLSKIKRTTPPRHDPKEKKNYKEVQNFCSSSLKSSEIYPSPPPKPHPNRRRAPKPNSTRWRPQRRTYFWANQPTLPPRRIGQLPYP